MASAAEEEVGESAISITITTPKQKPRSLSIDIDLMNKKDDASLATSYEKFTDQELLSANNNDNTTNNSAANVVVNTTNTNNNNDDKASSSAASAASKLHDLIGLTHLDEPAILHALKLRYESNFIYTSTGPILIAVNPFRKMEGLYGEEVMAAYCREGEGLVSGSGSGSGGSAARNGSSRNLFQNSSDEKNGATTNNDDDSNDATNDNNSNAKLPPHAYKTADDAYRAMKRGIENRVLMMNSPKKNGNKQASSTTTPTNQSILVSGESGAGKTMTTKIVLNYFAMLSNGQVNNNNNNDGGSGGTEKKRRGFIASTPTNSFTTPSTNSDAAAPVIGIERQVLQSNPLLEAFGNARTVRNDNSSRFGKYINIRFSNTSGCKLEGAKIDTYLLEKVRLIRPGSGERNYHIFYQLLESLNGKGGVGSSGVGGGEVGEERSYLGLDGLGVENFEILRGSGGSGSGTGAGAGLVSGRRDGVLDVDMHQEMLDAMATIGFAPSTISSILRLVTAILHCGNITFHVPHNNGNSNNSESYSSSTKGASKMDMTHSSLTAARLLGVSYDEFSEALTSRDIIAGAKGREEVIRTPLGREESVKGLEALMKALYGALFDFLVDRVNESITTSDHQDQDGVSTPKRVVHNERSGADGASIGVLDIFGFEIFDTNNFEQLCINYTNEALQQQFNKYVFKLEQEEYEREGIEWKHITFPDNQGVLDLINSKHTGMLALLDEQCIVSSTDPKLARYLYQRCSDHPRFKASSAQRADFKFGIEHYAGMVEYSTDGWLEKNDDQLPVGSATLLKGSEFDLIGRIQKFIRTEHRQGRGSIAAPSVASQFSSQLSSLRSRIDATVPHYIRCLKPNDDMVPDTFDQTMIVDQLRCGGVLEAVRVSRAGYPTRYPHDVFVARYYVLGYGEQQQQRLGEDSSPEVDELVGKIAYSIWEVDRHNKSSVAAVRPQTKEEFLSLDFSSKCAVAGLQLGRTKVFLRREALDRIEALRSLKFSACALFVQRVVRGVQARFYCKMLRRRLTRCAVMVQRAYRARVKRLLWSLAAVKVQAVMRGAIIRWRLSGPSNGSNNKKRMWIPYTELEDATTELETIKAERDELLASKAVMQDEVCLERQNQERLNSKIILLEAKLLKSNREEDRMGTAMKLMECSHTEALVWLEDEKSDLMNQNEDLSQQVESLSSSIEIVNNKISSLNAELDDVKESSCKEQDELSSKISSLESDLLESKQKARVEHEQHSKKIHSLETDLLGSKRDACQEQKQLKFEVASACEQISSLTLELDVAKKSAFQEQEQLSSTISSLKSSVLESKREAWQEQEQLKEVASACEEISSLTSELDVAKKTASQEQEQFSSTVSYLKSSLLESKREAWQEQEQLKTVVASASEQISSLTSELDVAKKSASQEQEQLSSSISSLELSLLESQQKACQEQEQLKSEVASASEQFSSLTSELDVAKKSASQKQKQLRSTISSLESSLLESRQEACQEEDQLKSRDFVLLASLAISISTLNVHPMLTASSYLFSFCIYYSLRCHKSK